jgi:hypothetical protein
MRHRENRKAGTAFGGAIKWHPSIANVFGLVANLCAEKIPGFLRLSFHPTSAHRELDILMKGRILKRLILGQISYVL